MAFNVSIVLIIARDPSRYGWLSPSNPDPLGERMAVLKRALVQLPHVEGLFWDFASLPQKGLNGEDKTVASNTSAVTCDAFTNSLAVPPGDCPHR